MGKQEKLAATKVKMSGSEKKNEHNTYESSSIRRVTRKFLEVSRCCAKQRQRNIQNRLLTKKCAARAKSAFLLIRPIVVFSQFIFCLTQL